MTGCLFNELICCMAIFTNKYQYQSCSRSPTQDQSPLAHDLKVKIFTVIYCIMPIPCNNMVNPLKTPISGDPAVSCGILR